MNALKWGPRGTDKVASPEITVTSLMREASYYDDEVRRQNGRVLTLSESLAVWQDHVQCEKVKGGKEILYIFVDQYGIGMSVRGYCEIIKNENGELELKGVSDSRFKELEDKPWLRAFVQGGESSGIYNGRVAVGFWGVWGLWITTAFGPYRDVTVAFVPNGDISSISQAERP